MQYENSKIHWYSDSNETGWYGVEGLYAEGTNLGELLRNAYAVKIDQDGGDVGFVSIEELPEGATELIVEFFYSQGKQ